MGDEPLLGNQQRQDGRNGHRQHEEPDADPLPTAARRKIARGPKLFGHEENEIRDGHKERDDVDDIHASSFLR